MVLDFVKLQKSPYPLSNKLGHRLEEIYDKCSDPETKSEILELAKEMGDQIQEIYEETENEIIQTLSAM